MGFNQHHNIGCSKMQYICSQMLRNISRYRTLTVARSLVTYSRHACFKYLSQSRKVIC